MALRLHKTPENLSAHIPNARIHSTLCSPSEQYTSPQQMYDSSDRIVLRKDVDCSPLAPGPAPVVGKGSGTCILPS